MKVPILQGLNSPLEAKLLNLGFLFTDVIKVSQNSLACFFAAQEEDTSSVQLPPCT